MPYNWLAQVYGQDFRKTVNYLWTFNDFTSGKLLFSNFIYLYCNSFKGVL